MTDYNPSVRQIPRDQPASPIPLQQDSSILTWLESTGRMSPREVVETPAEEEADSEELADLVTGNSKDDFEEDDLSLDDD
ncbi:DUF3134 domain-containing protein [Romeria aff. gracilis LEGE 07310]|uniref:DUF3134 domain-containing protein n=1 Tax=Vasconcelosia minhoensis LEGE 07310 TaxID=915328 RepID=A0A8J7AFU3_9CYAN|nr:DUF3134 domain-containing protein [Romeria gracilis]MBE9076723.1 DUF3134 domain-containing protein [Romeria aff. gracilis LEGE 07310]